MKAQTFTIAEFMAYNSEDTRVSNKVIDHLKRNERVYGQLVAFTAFCLITGSPEIVVEAYDSGAMAEVANAPFEALTFMGKAIMLNGVVLEVVRSLTIGGN